MIEGWQINMAPWALGIAGTFVLASVWFFFRSLKREGSTGGMVAMHLLRLVIAVLVALTFLRPERVVVAKRSEQPRVMVLWDGSGSMATRDVVTEGKTATSRADWVKSQVDAKFWEPLEKRYKVSVEAFAQPPANPKADVETEIGTDLNDPLERVRRDHPDLRAVLLLTDGDWNLGRSPITVATALAQRDVPVFAIGIGQRRRICRTSNC